MLDLKTTERRVLAGPGRRLTYLLGVAINAALLVAIHGFADRFAFVTDDVELVVPLLSLSLMAALLSNVVYQMNDAPPVKATGGVFTNLLSLIATLRILEVFPFDFSGGPISWEPIVKVVLVLAIVGSGAGVVTEAIKLVPVEANRERRKERASDN